MARQAEPHGLKEVKIAQKQGGKRSTTFFFLQGKEKKGNDSEQAKK
jgi:hypothetical protein